MCIIQYININNTLHYVKKSNITSMMDDSNSQGTRAHEYMFFLKFHIHILVSVPVSVSSSSSFFSIITNCLFFTLLHSLPNSHHDHYFSSPFLSPPLFLSVPLTCRPSRHLGTPRTRCRHRFNAHSRHSFRHSRTPRPYQHRPFSSPSP